MKSIRQKMIKVPTKTGMHSIIQRFKLQRHGSLYIFPFFFLTNKHCTPQKYILHCDGITTTIPRGNIPRFSDIFSLTYVTKTAQ